LVRVNLPQMRWVVSAALMLLACQGTEDTLLVLGESAGGAGPTVPELWVPTEGARWLARLDGAVDIAEAAEFFYLDADQQPAEDLRALHAQGRQYFCYLSAGTLESFRSDAQLFPAETVGEVVPSFPNEHWLDVRDERVRELMARRLEGLAAAGCDGVTLASLGGEGTTGFDLEVGDLVDYARFLAETSHAAGMSVGLTGPVALTQELWRNVDFGLAVACVQGSGCSEYAALRAAQKPVLYVELGEVSDAPDLCKSAQALGFDAIVSDAGFSGRCVVCRDIL
jgi:Glycoside-hydrolase family GH114